MTVRFKSKLNVTKAATRRRLLARQGGEPLNREEKRLAAKAEKRAKRKKYIR